MFESLLSHLGSLRGGTPKVTFESLLGHFNSFCASVELGGRPLHNPTSEKYSLGLVHGLSLPFSVVVHQPKFGSQCKEPCENFFNQK